MPESLESEVIVIGGGIVGLCTALSLINSNVSVTIVERNSPGQGASFGNAGTISPWSIIPQAVPGLRRKLPGMVLGRHGAAGVSFRHAPGYLPWMMRFLRLCNVDSVRRVSASMSLLCAESVPLYRQHLRGTGHVDLIRDSMYVHAFRNPGDASLDSLGNAIRAEQGACIERVDAAELRRIEPALSHEFKAAILIHGQARALDPGRIGSVFAEKLQGAGARFIRGSVRALERDARGGWTVHHDGSSLRSAKVVVSAGAWSADLLHPLGIRLPLAAERGYHLSFANPGVELNNSVMDAENHIVASSMLPGLRIAGIADFAGPDSPPVSRHIDTLHHCARSIIPDLASREASEWMGVRPSFPDSLPLIEELPGHDGLFAAFGHSHYGLMMAPKTGQIVANLITRSTVDPSVAAFGSNRFRAPFRKCKGIVNSMQCL